jgi:hypothetical protein
LAGKTTKSASIISLPSKWFADFLNDLQGVPVKVCNCEVFMTFNGRRINMNRFTVSALLVTSGFAGIVQNANGQAINATMQTASPRVATTRSAPAAKPVARPAIASQVSSRPAGVNPRRFNSNLPRTIAPPAANLQRTYVPPVRTFNPGIAALNAQRGGRAQQPIAVDPGTRQTESPTLAAMHQRRGIVTRDGNILDPATRGNEARILHKMREHRGFGSNDQTLASINPQRHDKTRDPEGGPQREKPDSPKDRDGKKRHHKKDHISHDEAFRRHWHEWHDRNWWHNNCETIVFVNTGYYFLDGSYWYPAYGYDPLQTYYDYDGPIYTYSNLLPDEVIANVQTALQDAGYYYGPITGSLSVDTRAAIANFQRDYGLQITGAIDEETVEALGLY